MPEHRRGLNDVAVDRRGLGEDVEVERQKFWSRMGNWIKSPGRGALRADGAESAVGEISRDHATGEEARTVGSGRVAHVPTPIERLEQQQSRVTVLVESMQEHMTSQAQRTDSIARSLEKLAESLSHLPESAQTQLGMLEKIGEEVVRGVGSARRLEDSLAQLPQLADAQREAMVSIGHQLEASRESNVGVSDALMGVRNVVSQVGESAAASTASLRDLRSDLATREQRVVHVLEDQASQRQHFAWVMIGLVTALLLVGIVALVRSW